MSTHQYSTDTPVCQEAADLFETGADPVVEVEPFADAGGCQDPQIAKALEIFAGFVEAADARVRDAVAALDAAVDDDARGSIRLRVSGCEKERARLEALVHEARTSVAAGEPIAAETICWARFRDAEGRWDACNIAGVPKDEGYYRARRDLEAAAARLAKVVQKRREIEADQHRKKERAARRAIPRRAQGPFYFPTLDVSGLEPGEAARRILGRLTVIRAQIQRYGDVGGLMDARDRYTALLFGAIDDQKQAHGGEDHG